MSTERLRRYLGGVGLGTAILLAEQASTLDPLSPEAPLVFAFSPLVGSPLTTSAKFAVVGKSPLTGYLNDSLASSRFAVAGKRCGADAIVIRGRAREPSVLLVDDGNVRCEPAGDLWGTTTSLAETRLRERFGGDYSFAVIGVAGEHRVRYATISHDGRHAGRGGQRRRTGRQACSRPSVCGARSRCLGPIRKSLAEYARDLSERSFGPATAKYRELGTASNLLLFNRLHALPTRNFQQGSFAAADAIAPDALAERSDRRRKILYRLHDWLRTSVRYSSAGLRRGDPIDAVRVEYESLFALGSLCGIDQPDVVLAGHSTLR